MERFICTVADGQAADQLWRAIKGKGAFRYFKDTAHRLDLLKQWFQKIFFISTGLNRLPPIARQI
jgi:hypothetical protein